MPDSVNDLIADEHRARAVDLLRFEPSVRRKAIAALDQLEAEIIARLQDENVTEWTRRRLESLLRATRQTIASQYGEIAKVVDDEMRELAGVESDWAADTINRITKIDLVTVGFTEAQIRAIVSNALIDGAPSREWWSRQAGDTAERFADAMRKGLLAGETTDRLIRRVRGTRANRYRDGIMAVSRRNAQSLVRSSVMAVSNAAYLETWRENADVVKALMHASTLDSRTSLICIARSGLRWTLDGEPIGHDMPFHPPPVHWSCRSVLVPITKSWAELGIDADEAPPGTRASMDGQVPEDMDFATWLRGKDPEFQDDLLGPGRAALWRSGRISLGDLIDQSDRPLTLDELKRIRH